VGPVGPVIPSSKELSNNTGRVSPAREGIGFAAADKGSAATKKAVIKRKKICFFTESPFF
jgi:hypothetical protein